MNLPIIYTVRIDLSDEVVEEATRWNNTKHISDLLSAGLLSAVRFRSIKGEPEYLHLYELPSVDLLKTEEYGNVKKNDTWGPTLTHGFSNHSASTYQQIIAVNVPETPRVFSNPRQSSVGGVRSKYLVTVRMDIPSDLDDEFVQWHKEEHIPMTLKVKDVVNARLCRKHGAHPVTPSRDPRWISIYEMNSLDALEDPQITAANETDWARQMHSKTSDVRLNIMERIFPE